MATMSTIYPLLALVVVAIIARLTCSYIPVSSGIKTIVNVVLGLIVVGIALWLINTYIPMAGVIKAILNIVVVIATCVGVLQAVGLWASTVRLWSNFTNHRISR